MQEQLPSSSTISKELPAASVAAVRAALGDLVKEPAGDGAALHEAVCALAHEARARAVPPEHLIVSLKLIWASETGEHPMPDRRLQAHWFDRTVSLCIREYFA